MKAPCLRVKYYQHLNLHRASPQSTMLHHATSRIIILHHIVTSLSKIHNVKHCRTISHKVLSGCINTSGYTNWYYCKMCTMLHLVSYYCNIMLFTPYNYCQVHFLGIFNSLKLVTTDRPRTLPFIELLSKLNIKDTFAVTGEECLHLVFVILLNFPQIPSNAKLTHKASY